MQEWVSVFYVFCLKMPSILLGRSTQHTSTVVGFIQHTSSSITKFSSHGFSYRMSTFKHVKCSFKSVPVCYITKLYLIRTQISVFDVFYIFSMICTEPVINKEEYISQPNCILQILIFNMSDFVCMKWCSQWWLQYFHRNCKIFDVYASRN
jgi:hypothetical protein